MHDQSESGSEELDDHQHHRIDDMLTDDLPNPADVERHALQQPGEFESGNGQSDKEQGGSCSWAHQLSDAQPGLLLKQYISL